MLSAGVPLHELDQLHDREHQRRQSERDGIFHKADVRKAERISQKWNIDDARRQRKAGQRGDPQSLSLIHI